MTRLILNGNQLYTLSVFAEDLDEDDPDVKKFFDSFRAAPAGGTAAARPDAR